MTPMRLLDAQPGTAGPEQPPRKPRPARAGVLAALAVLAVGAILPIWQGFTLNHNRGCGGLDAPGFLWKAIADLPTIYRLSGRFELFLRLEQGNLATGAILMTLAAGLRLGTYGTASRRRSLVDEAGDFAEGPDGSIPDGRA